MGNIENRIWAHRRALGAPLRPSFGASGGFACRRPAAPRAAGAAAQRQAKPPEAPNRGQSGPSRARRRAQTRFSMLPTHREKTFNYQHGTPSYQQNPRYQPKNLAICIGVIHKLHQHLRGESLRVGIQNLLTVVDGRRGGP